MGASLHTQPKQYLWVGFRLETLRHLEVALAPAGDQNLLNTVKSEQLARYSVLREPGLS